MGGRDDKTIYGRVKEDLPTRRIPKAVWIIAGVLLLAAVVYFVWVH